MQKKRIIIFVVFLVLVVFAVVLADLLKNRTDKRADNPYALEYDDYMNVDPELISHKETKNFKLTGDSLGAIIYHNDRLYAGVDHHVLVLSVDGALVRTINIDGCAADLGIYEDKYVVVILNNAVELYDLKGVLLLKNEVFNDRTVFTSCAVFDDNIMVADAGNRNVLQLDSTLKIVQRIDGKRQEADRHGFIVPSANFDLAYNKEGEIWVVNPGLHALEQYDNNGKIRSYWESTSFTLEGFSGCCNPVHIDIMEDGRFVTSEKGLVRVKIHSASGAFVSVVAPPKAFKGQEKAPDVAVGALGEVYVLDCQRKMIRVFDQKE